MNDLKDRLEALVIDCLPDESHFLVDLQLTSKSNQLLLNILIDADTGLDDRQLCKSESGSVRRD
jgi:hypothetical protein